MKVYTGTSGYSYKEWKGVFYPEKIKNAEMLSYYASQLASVEINNTFYRMPKAEVLERWASEVPEGFRFVLKASRRITHQQRLKDEAADSLDYLLEVSEVLQAARGPFLFQLPPFFKKDTERLKQFLDFIPPRVQAAFEFRNVTWFENDVMDALRDGGAALCIADAGKDIDAPFEATADFGYLRLRRADYSEAELSEWKQKVEKESWSEAYVFFKHEDEGAGPQMAAAFGQLFEV